MPPILCHVSVVCIALCEASPDSWSAHVAPSRLDYVPAHVIPVLLASLPAALYFHEDFDGMPPILCAANETRPVCNIASGTSQSGQWCLPLPFCMV
jgi:hypothetical protein